MTHQEKIDVLSLPMDELWIRVFESVRLLKRMYTGTNIEIDSDNHDYKNLYKKFESNYMFLTCCDNKKKLIEVFNNATSIELPWGLPKGRSDDRKETPIETAMREFKEETGVKKYTMLHHIKPVVYSYIDDNTKYEFVIFFAETTQNASINLLNPDQVNEISAIEFVNSETLAAKKQVRMLDLFRILKKKYKNHR
jgi:ADP-ribose pyrophosphatase YjhB (NUDIX family)